jgi:GNAT superfamily N-acetyltransferase
MQIRPLKRDEARLHRASRLRALKDAPDAFGESFEDAEVRPMTYWETLTQSVTAPDRHVMFLACAEDAVHGCTYGLLDRERGDGVRVGGMWVDPAQRRRGIGSALLQAVFGWARERQRPHIGLWAPTHHPGAIALYRRAGFVETGEFKPLPNQPTLQVMAMQAEIL